jgi:hypothetical protein
MRSASTLPVILALLAVLLPSALLVDATAAPSLSRVVIGVDGGTESIRACCFDAESGKVIGQPCAVPYDTHHPVAGWAEQDPADWYQNLGQAVQGAVRSIPTDYPHEICALAMDTTCCSVVALDANDEPLRPSLLWMDQRSAPQTTEIMERCKGDPALSVNCGGEGPLSAEWMTPKALWIRQNEPAVWEAAATICEYQDYLNYKLTGVMCASSCNAASRWHWDGDQCIMTTGKHPGRPLSLYETLGIPELAEKLPQKCLALGIARRRTDVKSCEPSWSTSGCSYYTGRSRRLCWNDWSRMHISRSTLSHYRVFASTLRRVFETNHCPRHMGCLQRRTIAWY